MITTNKHNFSLWQRQFIQSLINEPLEVFIPEFCSAIDNKRGKHNEKQHIKWQKQLQQLPRLNNVSLSKTDTVALYSDIELSDSEQHKTRSVLRQFMPWRKGPFEFFGIHIDTEWRSDWKWDRVSPHIGDLHNKRVLDVGCGSGYHLYRMHQAGANQVIGIDPTDLFFYQFQCFKQYLPTANIHFLPLGIEEMPATNSFDYVFSMGVLYHRHDPIKFLQELKSQLNENGKLVLETLVIEGDEQQVLMPRDRYAQMRNVWYIPSVKALLVWLERVGFKQIECVDVSITSIEEQRSTEWMDGHSLNDFLDPNDHSKTIEGYPAPLRATILAELK